MKFLRGLTSALAILILMISLWVSTLLTSSLAVVGQPGQIDQHLQSAGVYTTVSDSIVEQLVSNPITISGQTISLDRPVTRVAIKKALPPTLVQRITTTVLKGIYGWLNGQYKVPTYNIDLRPIKTAFANVLGTVAQSRIANLPLCSLRNLPTTTDPFSINCQPPAGQLANDLQQMKQAITDGPNFLPQNTITAQTTSVGGDKAVKTSTDSQPWYQKAHQLPQIFQWMMRARWLLGLVALLLVVALVFLASDRRRGLRRVAIVILISGVLILLATFGGLTAISKLQPHLKASSASALALEKSLLRAGQDIGRSILHIQLWFGGGLVVASAAGLVALHLTKPPEVAEVPAKPEPKK